MVLRLLLAIIMPVLASCTEAGGVPPRPVEGASTTKDADDADAKDAKTKETSEDAGESEAEAETVSKGKAKGKGVLSDDFTGVWLSPCVEFTPDAGQLVSQFNLEVKAKTAKLTKSVFRKITCPDRAKGAADGDFFFSMTMLYDFEATGASKEVEGAHEIHLTSPGYAELNFTDKENADKANTAKFCGVTDFAPGLTKRTSDRTDPLCMGPEEVFNVWKHEDDNLFQGNLTSSKDGSSAKSRPTALESKPWSLQE